MKERIIELQNGAGILFDKEAFILCRAKHKDEISWKEKFYSEGPSESLIEVRVPYNAECIVCCFYRDTQLHEWSIELLQNGKLITLSSEKGYWDDQEEFIDWDEEFQELIVPFYEKGYQRLF